MPQPYPWPLHRLSDTTPSPRRGMSSQVISHHLRFAMLWVQETSSEIRPIWVSIHPFTYWTRVWQEGFVHRHTEVWYNCLKIENNHFNQENNCSLSSFLQCVFKGVGMIDRTGDPDTERTGEGRFLVDKRENWWVAGGSHTAAPISPVSNQVENSKIGEEQEVCSERCMIRLCTKYIVERKPIPVRAIV